MRRLYRDNPGLLVYCRQHTMSCVSNIDYEQICVFLGNIIVPAEQTVEDVMSINYLQQYE